MRFLLALTLLAVSGVSHAATLYLTEFKDLPPVTYQAAPMPANASQTVAIAGASAQSAAFQWNTILVRVHCDIICNVVVGGTNPTATTSSMRMAAGQTEYFMVKGSDKLAVIAGT